MTLPKPHSFFFLSIQQSTTFPESLDEIISKWWTTGGTISRPDRKIMSTLYDQNLVFRLFIANLLVGKISSTPLKDVSPRAISITASFGSNRRMFYLRLAAALCAILSMIATYTTFCWFARMEKRFRHKLIMLLIYGDLMRATCIFQFAVVSMAQGTVSTRSAYCQVSGFMFQYSTETSDYAVLIIALHAALQVFTPSGSRSSEGLYPYRVYIILGAILIPTGMAALAFINPHWGYMSQAAFAALPLRPFWYRLALAWIPRYMIAAIILSLAIAIYAHVGFQMRYILKAGDSLDPSSLMTSTMPGQSEMASAIEGSARGASFQEQEQPQQQSARRQSVTFDSTVLRRTSAVASLLDSISSHRPSVDENGRAQSLPPNFLSRNMRRKSLIFPARSKNWFGCNSRRANQETFSSSLSSTRGRPQTDTDSPTASRTASPITGSRNTEGEQQLRKERARIYRQLRLMFVYPLVYAAMWVIPFALHCMMYTDKWAAHPIFWLMLLSTMCQSLIGFVDCLVFSLRERPWRNIPNSDGTFLGSFCWWSVDDSEEGYFYRRTRPSTATDETLITRFNPYSTDGSADQSAAMANIQRMRRSVRTSASSDNAKVTAEMARVRLEMEKEDRRREFQRRKDGGDLSKRDTATPMDVLLMSEDEAETSENGNGNGNYAEESASHAEKGQKRGRTRQRKVSESHAMAFPEIEGSQKK